MPESPNDFDWRESRRMRAWALHQAGWTQRQIAQELAVSQGSVSRWLRQVWEGGSVEALRRHPAPGKQALLSEDQFTQLPELIALGAAAFGFPSNQWTTKRVALALQQTFGVTYHPGHISRLLKKHCPNWRQPQKS